MNCLRIFRTRHAAALALPLALVLAPWSARAADAFSDKDEGSSGPLQDKSENQVVFAHSFIERSETDPAKIISQTTLKDPIFVRFFHSKTPARILHEKGQDNCFGTQRFDQLWAYLESNPGGRVLVHEAGFGDETFKKSRTSSITLETGKDSLLPLERVNITLAPHEHQAFVALVAQMKPGNNKVIFEDFIGCQTITKDDKPTIMGALTFVVGKGDLAAYAKRIGPDFDASGNAQNQKRFEPLFKKSMAKGSKLLKLAADSTDTEPEESQSTPIRALLLNVEGTCSYVEGWWKAKYLGKGKFEEGHFEAGDVKGFGNQLPVPCP